MYHSSTHYNAEHKVFLSYFNTSFPQYEIVVFFNNFELIQDKMLWNFYFFGCQKFWIIEINWEPLSSHYKIVS
jgi:hypothetical protein